MTLLDTFVDSVALPENVLLTLGYVLDPQLRVLLTLLGPQEQMQPAKHLLFCGEFITGNAEFL